MLIKLPQTGAVLITGDAVHFRENYDTNGVPWFNFDRAQSLASIDRMKRSRPTPRPPSSSSTTPATSTSCRRSRRRRNRAGRRAGVPRTRRSATSAFTRVFDALWHLRSGALQSRGRTERRCAYGPGSAKQHCVLHRARGHSGLPMTPTPEQRDQLFKDFARALFKNDLDEVLTRRFRRTSCGAISMACRSRGDWRAVRPSRRIWPGRRLFSRRSAIATWSITICQS